MKICILQKERLFSIELALLMQSLTQKKIQYHLLGDYQNYIAFINFYQPDLVLIHTTTFDLYPSVIGYNCDMLKNIKSKCGNIITGICGSYSSFYPNISDRWFIDKSYVGDLEGVDWNTKSEKIIKSPLTDLKTLKIPEEEIDDFLYHKKSFRYGYSIDVARGCVGKCNFCYNPMYVKNVGIENHPLPRYYPVELIIEICEYIKKNDTRCKMFYFSYGTITYSKEFFRAFVKEYDKRIALPYVCATRLDSIDDEIAELLSHHCSKITVGIESGIEKTRQELLNKNLSDKQIFSGIKSLKKYNIRTGITVLSGYGESIGDYFKTLEFIRRLKIDFISNKKYFPLPGTKLAAEYKDNYKITPRLIVLTYLYMLIPNKYFILLLSKLPLDRIYILIDNFQRIKAVLNYDMANGSVKDKIKYIFSTIKEILFSKRENLKFGTKVIKKGL